MRTSAGPLPRLSFTSAWAAPSRVGPLWRHWGELAIHSIPHGRLGHLVRPDTRRFVDEALVHSGFIHPER
jgi:hypothetical protein